MFLSVGIILHVHLYHIICTFYSCVPFFTSTYTNFYHCTPFFTHTSTISHKFLFLMCHPKSPSVLLHKVSFRCESFSTPTYTTSPLCAIFHVHLYISHKFLFLMCHLKSPSVLLHKVSFRCESFSTPTYTTSPLCAIFTSTCTISHIFLPLACHHQSPMLLPEKIPSKSGSSSATSETPFKWRFADRLMVTRYCVLAWLLCLGSIHCASF